MKKILLLLALGLAVLLVNAQKENGTVFSEHEYITKTKALWAAFVKGDKDVFLSFFADSVLVVNNGKPFFRLKNDMADYIDWWSKVENLTIKDDSPAYPDAIKYKNGELWVQDWLRITGIHPKTGINIDLALHDLYSFNKEGKIKSLFQYFDNNFFKEVANSERTIENGVVYINHPYIVTVRKLINAVCAENLEAWSGFFVPDASFYNSTMKANGKERKDLPAAKKDMEQIFKNNKNITMKQYGYPDCIYYAKDDAYVVLSWWLLSYETADGKKKSDIPMLYTHSFDKDGKITLEMVYYSSNHFE